MHIWCQLTLSKEQERGYHKMVGNTTQLTYICDPEFDAVDGPCSADSIRQVCTPRDALPETTLYIPLQFWYCRNPGLALPLIALQYHEVRINMEFRNKEECYIVNTSGANCCVQNCATGSTASSCICVPPLTYASLFVDYIYFDTDERRRFAQVSHEYLIEQLQFTGDESVTSTNVKVKLNFNHPCKELVWVVQRDS